MIRASKLQRLAEMVMVLGIVFLCQPWNLFLLPVAIFTFLLRNHLLRGMSFGAIRK